MSDLASVGFERQVTGEAPTGPRGRWSSRLLRPLIAVGRAGFTYIELVTVLLLLGVLAAIATKSLITSKSRAFAAAVESDLRNLAVAQEDYFAESGKYFDGGGAQFATLPTLDFAATPGVSFELRGDEAGWAGRAVHEKLTDRDFACSFYTGQVEPYPPAVQEGVVTCRPYLSGSSDGGNSGNGGNNGKGNGGNNGKGNGGNNGKGNGGNNGKGNGGNNGKGNGGNNGNGNGNNGNGNGNGGNNGNGNGGNNGNNGNGNGNSGNNGNGNNGNGGK